MHTAPASGSFLDACNGTQRRYSMLSSVPCTRYAKERLTDLVNPHYAWRDDMLYSAMYCWGALAVCANTIYPVSHHMLTCQEGYPQQCSTGWMPCTAELKVLADNGFPSGFFNSRETVWMGQRAMPTMSARARSVYHSSVEAVLWCLPRHKKEAFDSGLCAVF